MRYQYVYNATTKRLHLKIDGKSDERCNLDQLKDAVTSDIPPIGARVIHCTRCMPPDGSTPIGPVHL
jgi:hypothetical protein